MGAATAWLLPRSKIKPSEACEIAGLEPRFETLKGDADAYILALNIARRHLNKGQFAVVVEKAWPEHEAQASSIFRI